MGKLKAEGGKIDCPRLMPLCKPGDQAREIKTGEWGHTSIWGLALPSEECPQT
ncbi:MAG: hypothetical protein RQM92_18420 [Candidatus Syntrophopropionicum ammoniitolerans]